jgi:Concanavalin A-like lectin/glucanases superfamily
LPDTTLEVFGSAYGDNDNPPGSAAGVADSASYVATGSWYKLTYTYDGFTAKLYVNGVLTSTAHLSVSFTPNSQDLFIGRNEDPYSLFPYWLNGAIDEIRIYNRALPLQAITALNKLTE